MLKQLHHSSVWPPEGSLAEADDAEFDQSTMHELENELENELELEHSGRPGRFTETPKRSSQRSSLSTSHASTSDTDDEEETSDEEYAEHGDREGDAASAVAREGEAAAVGATAASGELRASGEGRGKQRGKRTKGAATSPAAASPKMARTLEEFTPTLVVSPNVSHKKADKHDEAAPSPTDAHEPTAVEGAAATTATADGTKAAPSAKSNAPQGPRKEIDVFGEDSPQQAEPTDEAAEAGPPPPMKLFGIPLPPMLGLKCMYTKCTTRQASTDREAFLLFVCVISQPTCPRSLSSSHRYH